MQAGTVRRRTPWIAAVLTGCAVVVLIGAATGGASSWKRRRSVVLALAPSTTRTTTTSGQSAAPPPAPTGAAAPAPAATAQQPAATRTTVATEPLSTGAAGATPVTGSRVLRVSIPGPHARIAGLGAYVYLPPGYGDPANASLRYPVLYLLHGTPGWPSDWFQPANAAAAMNRLIAAGTARPMIMVAPTANRHHLDDSECLNAVHGPQMETYLTQDVVAYADSSYRTLADRGHRAIGGISSGGFCALNLGLRHQDEFSVVLAQMPYGDPGSRADVTHRLLGDQPALYRQNSPSLYLRHFTFAHPMAFFLDAGSNDTVVVAGARRLEKLLSAHHQTVALRVVPHQSHSWLLARAEVPYSLRFASRELLLP